jgi:hypothetical protein
MAPILLPKADETNKYASSILLSCSVSHNEEKERRKLKS